jgi:hypothetical protein
VGTLPDRLVVDLRTDGQAAVLLWPADELPEPVSQAPLAWPLDGQALEDLRWYLEDYLLAPFGVWEDRGPAVAGSLDDWGDLVYGSLFGAGKARDAYQRARDRGLEGDMPLADWLVPVHYMRREVSFPQAKTSRPPAAPSLDAALDQIRETPTEPAATQDPLAAVDGLFVGRDYISRQGAELGDKS